MSTETDTGAEANTPGPDEEFCSSCGNVIKKAAEICPECGVRVADPPSNPSGSEKNRVTAALFAFFVGGLGAHKFYLGQTKMGIVYVLFCWTLIPMILGLVEGIIYLTKSDAEFERKYAN